MATAESQGEIKLRTLDALVRVTPTRAGGARVARSAVSDEAISLASPFRRDCFAPPGEKHAGRISQGRGCSSALHHALLEHDLVCNMESPCGILWPLALAGRIMDVVNAGCSCRVEEVHQTRFLLENAGVLLQDEVLRAASEC